MKKILMLLVAVLMITSVQAQKETKKNTYIKNGDLIEATLYHDNGVVSQIGFFTKDGKVTGEWISYNTEGQKTATAQYDNGAKVGKWFFWNNDTLTEVDYKDSRIAAVNTWKNEGTRVVSNK
ncbi:nicotinic acid mononucleotide adenyltransferase [uncultured Dokdonia sp.]|uniref:toxin-antitoxin system YwqK family antitoxin n=1 Tax=uncultured Dokdonia sp. TaxID=575653 RepID=UPI0026034653|nr:nicotinic acid mononucleotide adenyltransferase [uncultured Dokdonia sp.]